MGKRYNVIFLFCLVPFYLQFFEARFISASILNVSSFLFCILAVAFSINNLFIKTRVFGLPIRMFFFSAVFSMFMAYTAWGQGIFQSLIATAPFMILILFFFLLGNNTRIKDLELIAAVYGLVYAALYFYQYKNFGTILFGFVDEYEYDRGFIRILFPGQGIFYMAVFIGLNRMTIPGRARAVWILLAVLGLVVTLMQVTRQAILGVFFIYTFHLLRNLGFMKKLIFLTIIAISVGWILNTDNTVVEEFRSVQNRDKDLGKENIRYVAGEFLSQFSPGIGARIFGNGAPYGPSSYGQYVGRLVSDYGFFLSDVGLIRLITMFGLLPVMAYLLIWYKSITVKVPKQYQYVKYYLWFLLIASLTSGSVFSNWYLLTTVFILYIFEKSSMDAGLPS